MLHFKVKWQYRAHLNAEYFLGIHENANISQIMTHKGLQSFKARVFSPSGSIASLETILPEEVPSSSFLHIFRLQFICNSGTSADDSFAALGSTDVTETPRTDSSARRARPASSSSPHPIPSPGSDFTSFDISTALKGGWENEQKAEKPALNYAGKASLEPQIL